MCVSERERRDVTCMRGIDCVGDRKREDMTREWCV